MRFLYPNSIKFVILLSNKILIIFYRIFLVIVWNEINQYFDRTALHIAVQKGNQEIISLLVNFNGIDLNAEDEVLWFNSMKL